MANVIAALSAIIFFLTGLAGYLTHWWWAIMLLASDNPVPLNKIVLAVLGLIPPVGVIHGWCVWFGVGG